MVSVLRRGIFPDDIFSGEVLEQHKVNDELCRCLSTWVESQGIMDRSMLSVSFVRFGEEVVEMTSWSEASWKQKHRESS